MDILVVPGLRLENNVAIAANLVFNNDISDNSIAMKTPCERVKDKGPCVGRSFR